ncbi:Homeodomain-like protein [Cynara cardunculus var. scolymus]|uniref:Homeodomain-like protein n=1 Tax=Cynara cardunculus var. scolymus TaxID=59895 RepID=A0A103XS84_CYNCS|nr:Homeodomain-like protein [Cynara cardunculus var. scolymus]
MVRAPCFDKHGMKKGAWSQDEDNKLRAYIETCGHSNWRKLPKLAESSSSSSSSSSSYYSTISDPNESSPSSLSVSDANVTPKCSDEVAGSLWIDQFLWDKDHSIMLSSDKMFSPLGVGADDFIFSEDNAMDDVLLWSNLDLYY